MYKGTEHESLPDTSPEGLRETGVLTFTTRGSGSKNLSEERVAWWGFSAQPQKPRPTELHDPFGRRPFACRGAFRAFHTSAPSAFPVGLLATNRTYPAFGKKSTVVLLLRIGAAQYHCKSL